MRAYLLWSLLGVASCSQIPWKDPGVASTRMTLVDALSADPGYSHLLKVLQRAKLIPTLNRLNDSTLFALTNDAFESDASLYTLLNDKPNNIQQATRQLLFYHIATSPVPLTPEEQPLVLKTLHYPREGVQPPTHEPPPGPPWMPQPGGTLGGQPQRLRVTARGDGETKEGEEPKQTVYVGVDAFGNGGVPVVKGRVDAGNGVLLGINRILTVPPDLATMVSRTPELSYLAGLISRFEHLTSFLNSTSALTAFLPVNDAWESLHPLEKLYLQSEFAGDDLRSILELHLAAEQAFAKHEHVVYSEEFDPGLNVTTLSNAPLEIVQTPTETLIGRGTLVKPDVYASNGVIHLVDSLLLPPGHSSLRLTPEKFLLALNCTRFVSLLHSVNLTSFIDGSHPEKSTTILALNDDVFALFGGDGDLPERGSGELKRMMAYHFLDGIWEPNQVRDGLLVQTLLEEDGLGGAQQVMRVDVTGEEAKESNIRFAGASVIGDRIQLANNTLLYFVSRPLTPPAASLPTLLPHLTYSAFLAAVHSLPHLPDIISTTPSTTLLAPRDEAFKRLGGLVSVHLLNPEKSSQNDLERVLLHHIIQGVYYTESVIDGPQTFPTLEGSDLRLTRSRVHTNLADNTSLELTPSGGWPGLHANLVPLNLLTRTGAVHEVSDVLLPRSVEIGVDKLVKAAGGTIMANLINKAGMGWVLNGTVPPEDERWDALVARGKGKWRGGWTLLCPTDDAFRGWNLTALESDKEGLKELIEQHVIPTPSTFDNADSVAPAGDAVNSRPLRMDADATYSTLRSPGSDYGDVVFRAVPDSKVGPDYIVGIKNARGTDSGNDWAKVLSWGRSTASIVFPHADTIMGKSTGVGGVIQISAVLVPYHPPWWIAWGAPAVVGVVGILAICGFFWVVNVIWRKDVQEATYEPVGGFGRSEDVDEA